MLPEAAHPPSTAPRRRRRLSRLLAVGVLVLGLGATSFVGVKRSESVAAQRSLRFDQHAEQVVVQATSEFDAVVGLSESMAGLVAAFPEMRSAQFEGWLSEVDARNRWRQTPEFTYIQRVPLADVAAYRAKVTADRPSNSSPGPFDLQPAGERPSYCLLRFSAAGTKDALLIPVGFDICEFGFREPLERAAASGLTTIVTSAYTPVPVVVRPVFAGAMPADPAARVAAVSGWVMARYDMKAALTDLGRREHVVLTVRSTTGTALLRSTAIPRGALRSLRPVEVIGMSLVVDVAGDSPASAAPSRAGWVAGGLGAILSLLLASVVLLLGRGREEALALVEERTGELRHQALHDALTGLPNRALILDRAEHLLVRSRREKRTSAALFLDLDGFKDINDSLGHDAGDLLLQAVANRLRRVLRDGDTVGRMGGDEFVVLLEGEAMAPGPEVVAERILEVLREPFRLTDTDMTLGLSASIGIALSGDGSASDLLRDADIALYRAKANGRDCCVSFRPEMEVAVSDRLALGMELREALENGSLFLEYQPTFDIQTGRVRGVEALVRWAHPERGTILPLDFIPLAEETGIIVDLGTWVLREACRQMADWHRRGYRLLLNVNVSSKQLDRSDFVDVVSSSLRETGLPPEWLVLEITESVLMNDPTATAVRLHQLKRLGVQVAIDDFGTGYSSLSYLRQFPVDSIKIDRSFLADLGHSPEAVALLHSLIQLGKNLGLVTFAEGIELESQMDLLREEQCDAGQGYLFAHPLTAEAAEGFFANAVIMQNLLVTTATT
jgi:diguanylate cyclase (GGDEF)-like protein